MRHSHNEYPNQGSRGGHKDQQHFFKIHWTLLGFWVDKMQREAISFKHCGYRYECKKIFFVALCFCIYIIVDFYIALFIDQYMLKALHIVNV